MSHSHRSAPYMTILCAESEKDDKRRANRKHRRVNRIALRLTGDETELHAMRELSNVYDMAKDGKRRFDPARYPKEMRK